MHHIDVAGLLIGITVTVLGLAYVRWEYKRDHRRDPADPDARKESRNSKRWE